MVPRMSAPSSLRDALTGTRALLLDLDGVIVVAGTPVPGTAEAIGTLERRRIPYRIVTNTSAVSRETLSRWALQLGAPIPAARFQSALSASAAWTRRAFADQPLYVLASEDARGEFAGQRLLTHDEAGAPGARRGRRGGHRRRLAGRGHLREPQRRLPPGEGRRTAGGHAP